MKQIHHVNAWWIQNLTVDNIFFFFFFTGIYIFIRVFSVIIISLHLFWSWTISLRSCTPRTLRFFSTTSIYLFFDLLWGIFLSHSMTPLMAFSLLLLIKWPSNCVLCHFTWLVMGARYNYSWSSLINFLLHLFALVSQTGSHIILHISF